MPAAKGRQPTFLQNMKITHHPHSPCHIEKINEIYFVTAGTYKKKKLFRNILRMNLLKEALEKTITETSYKLFAFSLLPNHYHLLTHVSSKTGISQFIRQFHARSAIALNKVDLKFGRKVWYQYWDRCVRDENELLNNLNYVYWNSVKHGYAKNPKNWSWTWIKENLTFNSPSVELENWDDF